MSGAVLVLRALGLGDGLTGVPALRGVRRLVGPDARIVLAAPAAIGAFLVGLGLADELLPTPDLDEVADRWRARYGQERPELAVDLHGKGPRSHLLLQSLHPRRLLAWRCPEAGHLDGPVHDDGEHEVARWCRLLAWAGAACTPAELRLPPPRREPHTGAGGFSGAAAGGERDVRAPGGVPAGYVVVHAGAAAGARRWPADRFADVVRALGVQGRTVVLTGSAGESGLTAGIAARAAGAAAAAGSSAGESRDGTAAGAGRVRDLAGRLDLAPLAAVVAGTALVISGDTGVAHLATAYGIPSVLLFGPTPPAWWGPAIDLEIHRVLWHGPSLVAPGGLYIGDPNGDLVDPALARITATEVLNGVADVLQSAAEPPRARDPWERGRGLGRQAGAGEFLTSARPGRP